MSHPVIPLEPAAGSASAQAAAAAPPASPKRPALRLVSTRDMERSEWLYLRRQGIGSSDAAAAVGLNPYQSPLELWMHKTGREHLLPAIDPNDDSSPMYWGTLLEPIVAAHYTRRTGHKVRRINAILQHPRVPWMRANIDREVVGAPDVQLLECKTTGLQGARLWKDGVPHYVQLQVMHQLAVTGKQAADVAVLVGGQELQVHRIERDEVLIAQLMALEEQFWNYVQSDTPPPADASDSSAQALRSLYPHDTGETVDLTEDEHCNQAFAQLLHVRELLSGWQAQEALLKHRIQQSMGEASHARLAGGSVSWKRSKDSQELDVARLQKDHPEIAPHYLGSKPGSRRFLVHVDG